jgi:hypothetical protein
MPVYYEQKALDGSWTPVVTASAPAVDAAGREKRADGAGKMIRTGSIKEVALHHCALSLDALQNIYSQDTRYDFTSQRAQGQVIDG